MSDVRKPDARETALEVLMQVDSANAWSDGGLKRTIAKNKLDSRDAALATPLVLRGDPEPDAAGLLYRLLVQPSARSGWSPSSATSCVWGATRSCFWIRCRPVPPSTRPWR